jgi:hypothetical protein
VGKSCRLEARNGGHGGCGRRHTRHTTISTNASHDKPGFSAFEPVRQKVERNVLSLFQAKELVWRRNSPIKADENAKKKLNPDIRNKSDSPKKEGNHIRRHHASFKVCDGKPLEETIIEHPLPASGESCTLRESY